MTTFVPLNVEIEEESDDEIDDSKEIQIEEALKLYQNALKLHSQGPQYYDEAENAYNELFRSEIFTWEESLSEPQRTERYHEVDSSGDESEIDLDLVSVPATAGIDGSHSALPQILYLAYKNHGHFLLDRLRHQLSQIEVEILTNPPSTSRQQLTKTVSRCLRCFVEALDRDDTDQELWRLVSRIGSCLDSRRITRFCLETVLEGDESESSAWMEPLGLEGGFAVEQLRPLLHDLNDLLSQSQVAPMLEASKSLIASLVKYIDPCPYLPTPSPSEYNEILRPTAKDQTIKVPLRSWASCGKAILLHLGQEAQGVIETDPGASYNVVIPQGQSSTMPAPLLKTFTDVAPISAVSSPSTTENDPAEGELEIREDPEHATGHNVLVEPLELSPIAVDPGTNDDLVESPRKVHDTVSAELILATEADVSTAQAHAAQDVATQIVPVSLPTRKRSSETAEIPDSTEVGRSRSKRIKTRGSLDPDSLKDSTVEDWAKWYDSQLQIYHRADDCVFDLVEGVLQTLGSRSSILLETVRKTVSHQPQGIKRHALVNNEISVAPVADDLQGLLDGWDLGKSKAFLNGHEPLDAAGGVGGNSGPGFAAFLDHSNEGGRRSSRAQVLLDDYRLNDFDDFMKEQQWVSLDWLVYQWLGMLLSISVETYASSENRSFYAAYVWPESLKEVIVQMLVFQDQAIYSEICRRVSKTEQEDRVSPIADAAVGDESPLMSRRDIAKCKLTNLAQVIFELHLDVYGRITNPSSKVDESTRTLQRDRLSRWAALASKLMNQWSWPGYQQGQWSRSSDDLYVRFAWASVVCNTLLEPGSRDTAILCYQDLIRIVTSVADKYSLSDPIIIELPNNAIMPEISVEAAEKEISKLTTMDFFLGVFDSDNSDPLTIIESLEPLLDLSVRRPRFRDNSDGHLVHEPDSPSVAASPDPDTLPETPPDPRLLETLQFLDQGSLPLRLFLWQKLRDAYRTIIYPPQVLSCDLRMLALIVSHLASSSYHETARDHRRDGLLCWLHRLDDHLTRVLSIAISKPKPFECIDHDQIRVSLEAMTSLQKILHVFALWEDTIRVGQSPAPAQVGQNATKGLAKSTDKFRDMIVKTWTLQYLLLKETMSQNQIVFDKQEQHLVNYLQSAHQALGLRCYCSLASRMFLKLMKKELETFDLGGDYDIDMAQLIYDLYGVKTSPSGMEMQDHGSHAETLDRGTALEIMDLVLTQVNRISIKDLLRSDLKFAVDKMQQVIMIPKINNSATRTFNNRLVNNYLKSPINPYDLYRSLRGIGGLCSSLAVDEGSDIASKGWYFLLGQIALAKFRAAKRSSPGSTDDLSIARAFLRHDLEFDTNKWETWYRLGQVYDTLLEEDTTWTADKIDNHMEDLADLQRKAIHCYSMSTAVALCCAEGSFEDTSKMADLYADFGTRVYASTREPFSMKAFSLDNYKRHYNSRIVGMYQDLPFHKMNLYAAWKFASILLRRASVQKPQNWLIHFTYGKVLWKMHNCSNDVRGTAKLVGHQSVIDAFVQAIEACPDKRDNRHPEKDPILEPHYKLVSVVHKLVRSARIKDEEGRRILGVTPYARKASEQGSTDWNGYIMQILKALRSADKSNWHHRMVARAAHIFYDDDPGDPRAASGAKMELSQQIFTKTMSIQVWKPDNERAGRHFIYTGRYVRFFTRLLYQLNDKASLDALARRIRKRAGDFVDHASIWQEVCHAYLKLLHHQPNCIIMDDNSELVFQGMEPEIFQLHAARLEMHVQSQESTPPLLEILREAIELKKLNNNLLKPVTIFEDLIRDIYAHLYDDIIPTLIKNDAVEENRVRMRVDNILANPEPIAVETPPPEVQGGEHFKKSGARYVTPREIVRKAEAIAAKPAPSVPTKTFKALTPAPALESGAVPPSDAPRLTVVIHTDGANDVGSSVPGSVHDSADDESELSDVEEDAEGSARLVGVEPTRTPMFPNLLAARNQHSEEVEEDTNDEPIEDEDEVEEVEEVEADAEMADAPSEAVESLAKESGVHEGSW